MNEEQKQQAARLNYEAYCQEKNIDPGKPWPYPKYDALSPEQKSEWRSGAEAVIAYVVSLAQAK